MKIHCPKCDEQLAGDQINVAKDVAFCPNCEEAFAISSMLTKGQASQDFNLDDPPKGAWFVDTGLEWRIGASTRSPIAFFLIPFMCVWSGFSLGGIYGMQIANGEFNLLLSLFGIPFLLGTLLFGSIALMSVCGNTYVAVEGSRGRVFAGVGSLGWTRQFNWDEVNSIEETFLGYQHAGSNGQMISLIGQSRINFGSMLMSGRRHYLLQGLRKLLAQRNLG